MQAIPTLEGFLNAQEVDHEVIAKVELPPLVPGVYSVTLSTVRTIRRHWIRWSGVPHLRSISHRRRIVHSRTIGIMGVSSRAPGWSPPLCHNVLHELNANPVRTNGVALVRCDMAKGFHLVGQSINLPLAPVDPATAAKVWFAPCLGHFNAHDSTRIVHTIRSVLPSTGQRSGGGDRILFGCVDLLHRCGTCGTRRSLVLCRHLAQRDDAGRHTGHIR